MVKKMFFVSLFICVCLNVSFAYVIGQEGGVYEIEEKNAIELIKNKISKIDISLFEKELQSKLKEKIKKYRLPNSVAGLPAAKEERVYRVDLSYRLPFDIKDYQGNIIYPKGFVINPLKEMAKKGIYYPYILVIINGERKEEVEWFKKNFANTDNVKLFITDGNAYNLSKELKKSVFYLVKSIKDRFYIEETPSVVYQPKQQEYIIVQTFVVKNN